MDSDDQNGTPHQTNPIEPTTPSALNITDEFLVSLALVFFFVISWNFVYLLGNCE